MLNKQGDNIQAWHTPFPVWNQSTVSCLVLIVTSWTGYRFLRRQVRWSGKLLSGVWLFATPWTVAHHASLSFHISQTLLKFMCIESVMLSNPLFKNFPQFVVIHTVKDFSIVNEVEVDVFLKFSSFFYDPTDVGSLIFGSSAFSKIQLEHLKDFASLLLKPSLKDFEHYFAIMLTECNCARVWTFFDISFLWDWNYNWHFSVLWPLLSFPNLLACWVQHFHSIIF